MLNYLQLEQMQFAVIESGTTMIVPLWPAQTSPKTNVHQIWKIATTHHLSSFRLNFAPYSCSASKRQLTYDIKSKALSSPAYQYHNLGYSTRHINIPTHSLTALSNNRRRHRCSPSTHYKKLGVHHHYQRRIYTTLIQSNSKFVLLSPKKRAWRLVSILIPLSSQFRIHLIHFPKKK